jgi:hypothetical protein
MEEAGFRKGHQSGSLFMSNSKRYANGDIQIEQRRRMLIISLLWQWWSARNNKNAADGGLWVRLCTIHVNGQLNLASSIKKKCTRREAHEVLKWIPSEGDALKINIDGACSENPRTGGWGLSSDIVARIWQFQERGR